MLPSSSLTDPDVQFSRFRRIEEAKAAGARVLGLQPVFRYGRFLSSVNCVPELAASLSEALRDAGLPE
jgi:hypothetical protein